MEEKIKVEYRDNSKLISFEIGAPEKPEQGWETDEEYKEIIKSFNREWQDITDVLFHCGRNEYMWDYKFV